MKCNNCQRDVTKVEDVLDCRTCVNDGTANEIPKDMAKGDPLTAVLERKPGLAARFIADPPPPPTKAEVKAAAKVEAAAEKAADKVAQRAKAVAKKKPKAKTKTKTKTKTKAKAKATKRRR